MYFKMETAGQMYIQPAVSIYRFLQCYEQLAITSKAP
jgi:hypothetical protein